MRLLQEMQARGYEFCMPESGIAQQDECVIVNEKIMMPLSWG